MFELSIALKYLVPRWRQLSVSIISLISVFVIALVVWLIVVFFSVTHGLEKNWIEKLIALTAPVRVTPTPQYYDSYYYLADSISSDGNYTLKTIGEKLAAKKSDPYNPDFDEEIPGWWPSAPQDADGNVKDLVKEAFHCILAVPGTSAKEYEMTTCNLQIAMESIAVENLQNFENSKGLSVQNKKNIKNILSNDSSYNSSHNSTHDTTLNSSHDSSHGHPTNTHRKSEDMVINQTTYLGSYDNEAPQLSKSLLPPTHDDAQNLIAMSYQKPPFAVKVDKPVTFGESLPSHLLLGDAILLPKSYRDAGVLIGDRGSLIYQTPTATSIQEQRLPIFVAGFYDPGILPLGGKIALVNPQITRIIRSAYPGDTSPLTNGINVRFANITDAVKIKEQIELALKNAGIDKYWKVETYRDFEFTKNILQQLSSERNLFTLLAMVIIIVACSNIVSMLIILVNDKKIEIGILRSMGATSTSIAIIFGLCGFIMGFIGSLIGISVAILTLKNLQSLINLISSIQGYEMFNSHFYGDVLPNEISPDALIFVVITTCVISLLAGIVPAVKASLVQPSTILRSE